jgi:lysophospholipase L1-like esterase
MRINGRTRLVLLSYLILAACTDAPVTSPTGGNALALDEGRGEFQRYAAIGTSISMGVASDGVYDLSQQASWPAQLARLAHRDLSLPLIEAAGCGAPLAAPLARGVRISGEPAGLPADERGCAPNVDGVTLPAGNVAVDGARTRDALFATTTTYAGLRGRQYTRVLPAGQTQLSAALGLHPKVLSIELGGNEVLGARSGIYIPAGTVEQPAGSVERTEVFKALYTQLLDQVEAARVQNVLLVGLIDDPMDFPSFRTGHEIWEARASFARLYVNVAEDCGTVNATNVMFVAVRIPDAAARGSAAARAGQPPFQLNCFNAPSTSGVQDFVLTASEMQQLGAQITEMDRFIESEAQRRGFAYSRLGALYSDANVKGALDAFAFMTTLLPYGPFISLDGIHPTAAGQTVLANAGARALNARYGLGIPEAPIAAAGASFNVAPPTPTPASLTQDEAASLARTEGWEGGAFVLNSGAGKPDAFCFYQGLNATRVTVARSPSGNWTLSCSFENLPPIAEQQSATGWLCSIIGAPADQTHQSSFVRTTSGQASLNCQFSGKPIENASIAWGDLASPAQEANFTQALGDLPGKQVSGETFDAGLGCGPIAADLAGKIAIIERGVCAFDVKIRNAMNAGAAGAIVYNSAAFGDQIITMAGASTVGIPSVFVGRSSGLALRAASPTQVTITSCGRSASCRGEL